MWIEKFFLSSSITFIASWLSLTQFFVFFFLLRLPLLVLPVSPLFRCKGTHTHTHLCSQSAELSIDRKYFKRIVCLWYVGNHCYTLNSFSSLFFFFAICARRKFFRQSLRWKVLPWLFRRHTRKIHYFNCVCYYILFVHQFAEKKPMISMIKWIYFRPKNKCTIFRERTFSANKTITWQNNCRDTTKNLNNNMRLWERIKFSNYLDWKSQLSFYYVELCVCEW